MDMFHWTDLEAAKLIVAHGFRDGVGTYMTLDERSGVWLTNTEDDPNHRVLGDTVLKIEIKLAEDELAEFEWVEHWGSSQVWLVPVELLNKHIASVKIVT